MSALVETSAPMTWPAAVSPLVADALDGPPSLRRVLGSFPTCVYIALGRHDRVLAVHTPDAVPLPIGLRLAVPVRLDDTARPGDLVAVGGGRVRLPGGDVVAVRWSRPKQVGVSRASPARACRLLGSLAVSGHAGARAAADASDGLAAVAHHLAVSAVGGGPVEAATDRLVGAGRGLTPSGDDLLCGILLTLRAFEGGSTWALGSVQRATLSRLHRTTSISAALVAAAANGWAAPDVVRLLALLGGRPPLDRGELAAVWHRVSTIGHTSGVDLLAGVAATLTALMALTAGTPPSRFAGPTHEMKAIGGPAQRGAVGA